MRHNNHGLRKRCNCPRSRWPKCQHGWHFNFRWKGVNHRLSLDRECGRHIDSKTAAQQEAERVRLAIREGRLPLGANPARTEELTFRQFADVWQERKGKELVRPKDNG